MSSKQYHCFSLLVLAIALPIVNAAIIDPTALCRQSSYIDLCNSVVGNVRGGPAHAMKAAIRVTLTKTIQGKAVIEKLRATAARSEKGNLGVCKDNYNSAVNDLQSALVCLRNKDKAGLKNQLSAVVTYFETCNDAYTEEPGETNPLGDVSGVVQQLASNNLAIADHLNF